MIVVMKQGASKEMVEAAAQRVEDMGLKPHIIVGTERTVIAAARPQLSGPSAFMWLTMPTTPPSSAMRITSRTDATTPML